MSHKKKQLENSRQLAVQLLGAIEHFLYTTLFCEQLICPFQMCQLLWIIQKFNLGHRKRVSYSPKCCSRADNFHQCTQANKTTKQCISWHWGRETIIYSRRKFILLHYCLFILNWTSDSELRIELRNILASYHSILIAFQFLFILLSNRSQK